MKRYFFAIVLLLVLNAVVAQDMLNGGITNNFQDRFTRDSLHARILVKNKWSLNTYSGMTTGFSAWSGGHATTFAVPMGIQLNRMINNNVYAFAGLNVAPAYTSLRQNFMSTDFSKTGYNNSFLNTNHFSLYQRAEVGLGYTNDARTFQVSGSIGVTRYPNGNRFFPVNAGSMPYFGEWELGRSMQKVNGYR